MAASRSIFRVLSDGRTNVSDIMKTGNARLHNDIRKGMFVALLYGILDGSRNVLSLSNAGQAQPILCPANGGVPSFIETEGDTFPLGILDNCDYRETGIPFSTGDMLVFYTDGVVEAMNAQSEIYGFDRFMESVSRHRGLGAREALAELIKDVDVFVGGVEQHDDLTIVVIKAMGEKEGQWGAGSEPV